MVYGLANASILTNAHQKLNTSLLHPVLHPRNFIHSSHGHGLCRFFGCYIIKLKFSRGAVKISFKNTNWQHSVGLYEREELKIIRLQPQSAKV